MLVPFLSDKKNWRATRPPPTPLFPKIIWSFWIFFWNFQIDFFLSIIERPNNYFRDKMTPYISWGKVFKLRNLPIVLFAIGKYAYIFWVGRGGRIFRWEDFPRGESFMEREVSRGWTFQGEFYTRWIRQNSYAKISLFVLLSLYQFNFRRGDSKGNCPGFIFASNELSRGYFCGEGDFLWRWSQVFRSCLKNDRK